MRHSFAATLILMIFFISSCGFQLRGTAHLPQPLQNIYIKSSSPYSQLTRNLKDYFKTSGAHLTDSPKTATTVVEILSETTTQQLLTVSSSQQTRQYDLILTVVFQLTDPDGKPLIPQQTLAEKRTLTMQANQILAGSNEANNLYHLMQQSIVYAIVNRLSSIEITNLLTKRTPYEASISTTELSSEQTASSNLFDM